MNDMLDPRTVIWHATNAEIATWPITKTVAVAQLAGGENGGVKLTLDPYTPAVNGDRWPDRVPAGWDGTIRWTLCLAVNIAGVWHGAAFHEMWHDREWTGAGLLDTWLDGWGDARGIFGLELRDHRPKRGDKIALMAVAGQHRLQKCYTPGNTHMRTVLERSPMVVVEAQDTATYRFEATPAPVPEPPPAPVTTVTPGPGTVPPPTELQTLLAEIRGLRDDVRTLLARTAPVYTGQLKINTRLPLLGAVNIDSPVVLKPTNG